MSSVAAVSSSPSHAAQPASSNGNGVVVRKGRKKKQLQQIHDANNHITPAPSNNANNANNNNNNNNNNNHALPSASSPHAPFITPPRPARSPTAPATTATAKPDLAHLVGRPLVPFFLTDGSENTDQQHVAANGDVADGAGGGDGRQWGVSEDGRGVAVRQFVDGYFVEVGTIGQQQQQDGSKAQTTPRTAPAKAGGKNGKAKGKAATVPASATAAPGAAVSYSAALQQGAPPAAKRALHPAPSPPPPSTPLPSPAPAKYGAPAFTNSPSPMKVPLPKFLKDKSIASSATASVPSVPAISEEKSGYVRGPSLMHLLQQPTEEEEGEGKAGEDESVSNGHGSFVPISLMHLLQPQSDPTPSAAHDASLLHSATSVPMSSFSPAFIPPPATTSVTDASVASSSDVALSMPKLLFFASEQYRRDQHRRYCCASRLAFYHRTVLYHCCCYHAVVPSRYRPVRQWQLFATDLVSFTQRTRCCLLPAAVTTPLAAHLQHRSYCPIAGCRAHAISWLEQAR